MTPDAFRRFLLVVACTLYIVGLVVVWRLLGPWVAVAVYGLGLTHAIAFSIEPEPAKPKPVKMSIGAAAGEGLSRLDIARRARAAGDEDDD